MSVEGLVLDISRKRGAVEASQIAAWLREMEDSEAVSMIEPCSLRWEFIDLIVFFDGGVDRELYNVVIETPGRIFKDLNGGLREVADRVEEAIRGCAAGNGTAVRGINWVPKPPSGNAGVIADEALAELGSEHIRLAWIRALDRRESDPAGAITAARTLLESVLKHLLDEEGVSYGRAEAVPKLYGRIADTLALSPASQPDPAVKRILGACHTVVVGLAELRNNRGDAHGQRKGDPIATRHEAGLAINAAGSIATFLIEVHKQRSRDAGNQPDPADVNPSLRSG